MIRKLTLSLACLLIAGGIMAQSAQTTLTFDAEDENWEVKRGKAEALHDAEQGKALKLHPRTSVSIRLDLQPASSYLLTAWMRTESGADDMTMQTVNLAKNNISVTTALATWTKFERTINLSANQSRAELEFLFGNSQGHTNAWVGKLSLTRIGDYKEIVYTGIPDAPVREVKTDLGITMQPDDKMQWMLDDKLGLFIHWGLYAGPGKGEWYMENHGVDAAEYRKLAYPQSGDLYFDAKAFDAGKWVALAKKMGARYMNMVAQHHDGYALFESKYIDAFTSKQTHNRDFVAEYIDACRQAGLKVGIYKTLINWRFPGYYDITGTDCKPNKFGHTTAAWHKESARLMKEELYCQLQELMTKYGKIDQLFWDGGWLGQQGSDADGAFFWESGKYQDNSNTLWPVNPYFQDKDEATGTPLGLMGIVRKHQPDILVNPRSGWIGDYTCEEGMGAVRGHIRTGVVEKCMALSPGWGYTPMAEDPDRVMPLNEVKRIFADCLVRNISLMINIGPDRHGNVPKLYEQRLIEFGQWVHATSEAVYGTRGGPWQPVDGQYGFCYKDNTIYVYFLGEYTDNTFTLPPINKGMKALKAYNVYTKEPIKTAQNGQAITLKNIKPQADDLTVIAVVLNQRIR